jgi:hypothetical protein
MIIVSVLSASFLLLSAQPAAPASAPVITVMRGLDQVTLKVHGGATIAKVMETLKQEAQIESAQIDPKFASAVVEGEWTAKDWDELLFVALSGIPEMKVLVVGGPDGTDWQVAGGSEKFVNDFKLMRQARAAAKASSRSDPTATATSDPTGAANLAPEVVEPEPAKTEQEVKEEQAQSLATFTSIAAPPAGPPIPGQQVALPFPSASGEVPVVYREGGALQLPFPGYTPTPAAQGPFPPSKDPAMQALIDMVNQANQANQKPVPKK